MKTPTKEETTQLSGLSDFELKLDELSDKIKVTKSSLECIGLLRSAIEAYHSEKLPEELKKFFAYFHASDEGAEEIVRISEAERQYFSDKSDGIGSTG